MIPTIELEFLEECRRGVFTRNWTYRGKPIMQNRKEYPMARGLLDYFPDALMEVANVSHVGNQQHNPGQEMHWAKDKSTDHADCILRHMTDRGTLDTDKLRHSAKVAWRALAMLQIEIEKEHEADFRFLNDTPAGAFKTGQWLTTEESPTANGIGGGNYEAHEYADEGHYEKHDQTKPVKTVYISGPMRGMLNLNFPAFDAACVLFNKLGYRVHSPADADRADTRQGLSNAEYARRDLDVIFNCSHIAMLIGWEKSVGALAEFALARWLGLVILDATTGQLLKLSRGGDVLSAVDAYLKGQKQ